jgi:diguanylate cyclase (GGDEF)-like protein
VARWLTTVGTLVVAGVFIDALARRLRREAGESAASASNLAAVADAAHELARSTDADTARAAICDGAREISGAAVTALLEPSADGRSLAVTASQGIDLRDATLPFVGGRSASVEAFTSRAPRFISDVPNDPGVSRELAERTGAASALFQPVLREDVAIGVLAIVWQERVTDLPERMGPTMTLLAAEAAVAIERAELLERLQAVARTDDLTGLRNRRAWEEELPRELARTRRDERPLCVAMLDLDHFKAYNDEHGHQAGDRLLKQAAAWSARLRMTDLMARYGGEEFSVALPDTDLEHAVELAERLRDATPGGQRCSVGIAVWDGSESPESLVGRADAALYDAKRTGRDRTVAAR